jgi:hypothetical protein
MVERKLFFYGGENAKFCKKILKLKKNLPRCRVCEKFPAVTFPRNFSQKSLIFYLFLQFFFFLKICRNLVRCKYFTTMGHPMPMKLLSFSV